MKKSNGKGEKDSADADNENENGFHFKVNDKRVCCDETVDDLISEITDELPSYVDTLKQKNEESEKQLKEYINAYKQKISESDAFKKRIEENVNTRIEQAKGDIICSFLPVADNLERAIIVAENEGDKKSLLEGIKMVHNIFRDRLKDNGLEAIETVGKTFDPNAEEAVAIEEVSEQKMDNVVVEVYEKGYKLGERLIRPSKVKVGKFSDVTK